jgi:hypothetical protein
MFTTPESSVAAKPKNGIEPFDRLVEQVMTRPPYNDARRVFWIVDNCSAHRGIRAVERLRNRYPRLNSCMHRCTPVGSTRLRTTSRLCSARC